VRLLRQDPQQPQVLFSDRDIWGKGISQRCLEGQATCFDADLQSTYVRASIPFNPSPCKVLHREYWEPSGMPS
jgi:hypothetical protein